MVLGSSTSSSSALGSGGLDPERRVVQAVMVRPQVMALAATSYLLPPTPAAARNYLKRRWRRLRVYPKRRWWDPKRCPQRHPPPSPPPMTVALRIAMVVGPQAAAPSSIIPLRRRRRLWGLPLPVPLAVVVWIEVADQAWIEDEDRGQTSASAEHFFHLFVSGNGTFCRPDQPMKDTYFHKRVKPQKIFI
jgi:hypothetical protein